MDDCSVMKNACKPIFQASPDYKQYKDRIKTFRTWPKAHAIDKHILCNAGFYYTGQGDRVMCFCCKLVLNQFERHDIPYLEHLKYNSDCSYLETTVSTDPDELNIVFKGKRNGGLF